MNANLASLERLLKEDRISWGDYEYYSEKLMKNKESSAERKAREAKAAAQNEDFRKKANIQKKQAKFVNKKGVLKKIAKKCKWECQGEKCWAHEAHACPYIHKGDPGSNKTHSVKKGGKRTTRKVRQMYY
jgi:hypothetical protein